MKKVPGTQNPDKGKTPSEKLPSTGVDAKQTILISMILIVSGFAIVTINKLRKENS